MYMVRLLRTEIPDGLDASLDYDCDEMPGVFMRIYPDLA